MKLLLAGLLCAGACCADSLPAGASKDYQIKTCDLWTVMSWEYKGTYLFGYLDAIEVSVVNEKRRDYVPGATVKEIAAALDHICEDPANKQLYLPLAVMAVALKLNQGWAWQDSRLNKLLADFRQDSAKTH